MRRRWASRALNDARGMAETHDLLGMTNGFAGATVTGVRHYERAIVLWRDIGETQAPCRPASPARRPSPANPASNDATYSPLGSPVDGPRELAEALALAQRASWLAGQAFAHRTAAAVMAAHGQFGPALGHGQEALRIASEIGHQQWMAAARWALGQTYLALLMPIEAGAHLEEQGCRWPAVSAPPGGSPTSPRRWRTPTCSGSEPRRAAAILEERPRAA